MFQDRICSLKGPLLKERIRSGVGKNSNIGANYKRTIGPCSYTSNFPIFRGYVTH